MKYVFYFALFAMLLIQISCKSGKNVQTKYLGFYNVENLFDTIDTPDKDDAEFLPDGKNNWNSPKYFEKLDHINEVIEAMGSPSILGFCEIENRKVVQDIVDRSYLKGKYGIVHYESNDQRGIDNAMIYDSTLFNLNQSGFIRFNVPDSGRPTRDIVWAKLTYNKDTLLVMVNHWPSRSGGQEISEPKRIAAAEAAKHFIDSVMLNSPQVKIAFMGDLNDYPENVAPSMIAEVLKPLISPESGDFGGSHAYRGEWGVLDHIMVNTLGLSSGTIQFKEESGKIISQDFMKSTYKGDTVPFRTYGGGNYLGGYSDHFPVRIEFEIKN